LAKATSAFLDGCDSAKAWSGLSGNSQFFDLDYRLIRYQIMVPYNMQRKHRVTLESLFARPVSGTIRWAEIEALFVALGGEVSERAGSRVGVFLFGEVRVFHRPHPSPMTDKGAVASIRKWLESHGVKP
jgi:hypothetical protein